jgi:CTP:molybdopterin cytidylyltransferase MocA
VQRRRRIEAQALAAIDQTDAALLLLADDPGIEDLRLRADINWSRKSWADAARDYASSIAASASLNAPEERTAAVRAAAAFLLAGDRAGYRAFAKESVLRLEGTPEAKLIATLGDVDREQFLARFMSAYRAVYSGEGG